MTRINIQVEQELLDNFTELYNAPFKYDANGTMIFDKNMNHVLDIRGWGRIQKYDGAEVIQDNVGLLLVEIFNQICKEQNKEVHNG